MSTEDKIEITGEVIDILPAGKFLIRNDAIEDHIITGYLSGKLRKFKIKILLSDRVKVEVSPYDLEKGRIIYREK